MAPFSHLLFALALLVVTVAGGSTAGRANHYDRIFSFGDSLTDTGNAAVLPATAGGLFTRRPYGETYSRRRSGRPTSYGRLAVDFVAALLEMPQPTPYLAGETAKGFRRRSGRASDGRLVVDFIAEALELAQPTPYLAGKTAKDFRDGANFAVGGATALSPTFLNSRGIRTFVPVSLSNQTSWFKNVLQLLASSSCNEHEITASSIFFLGEIGLNDYSFVLLNNGTVDMAASLVPHIIAVIRSALIEVIGAGATTAVVTGMIPMGCEPELLALYPGGAGDYDRVSGCITRVNGLAKLHNRALAVMIHELRLAYPYTDLHYADFYGPVIRAVSSPQKYGFNDTPLTACCGGGGGAFNFNFTYFCGAPGSTVCANPSQAISWDGIHYTEATNRFVADAMLRRLML